MVMNRNLLFFDARETPSFNRPFDYIVKNLGELYVSLSLKYAARYADIPDMPCSTTGLNILAYDAQESHPASDLLYPPGALKHDHMELVCPIDLQRHTVYPNFVKLASTARDHLNTTLAFAKILPK